jgi:NAD(P)-dependent dehydrogenase (short-subunit alcohol dehydrogenase family)
MDSQTRLALVTGANRGLGFEVCRQLGRQGCRVILTSRDPLKGQAAAQILLDEGLSIDYHQLDITDEAGIQAVYKFVRKKYHRLDILVNNAGIYLRGEDNSVMTLSLDALCRTLETNTFGALRLCQVFIPLMKKNHYGRVVNVSSSMGRHVYMGKMAAAYRLSKDALNALTQMIAASIQTRDVLVNSCHPGWVRTELGGRTASLSVEEGADTIVWLATLPEGGPSGGLFENRQRLEW